MDLQIGIPERNLSAGASILNQFLADELDLYYRTKVAHWNVEGPGFYTMHKFFETQYEQLDEVVDEVAERIRALGHYTDSFVPPDLRARATDLAHAQYDAETFIRQLLSGHERVIESLRTNIECFAVELQDIGTSDFITGLMEKHEKMAWMLRAHLKV